MNIHHLELFYYVARHGGISRAVRHIPYGIQQPAVSSQILQLEEDLGKRLFERSPFRLTAAGGAAAITDRCVRTGVERTSAGGAVAAAREAQVDAHDASVRLSSGDGN